jgi:cytochrome c oxidase subunit 1/cytochrome c oxidase subunit I+III
MSGVMLREKLGQIQFWVMLVGFNLTFFPQHIAGMLGMPRRIYTYAAGQGWEIYNLLSTIGAYIIALAVLIFLINVVISLSKREKAGDNPWGAPSLEWSISSPPPDYNFAKIPTVTSGLPLWEHKQPHNESH